LWRYGVSGLIKIATCFRHLGLDLSAFTHLVLTTNEHAKQLAMVLSLLSRDARRLIQAFFAKPQLHQEETGDRNDFAKKRAKSIQSPFSRHDGRS
jgi:hypothetical protein